MELQPAQEVARGGGASSSGARELVGGAQSTQMVSSGCGGLCPSPINGLPVMLQPPGTYFTAVA